MSHRALVPIEQGPRLFKRKVDAHNARDWWCMGACYMRVVGDEAFQDFRAVPGRPKREDMQVVEVRVVIEAIDKK